MDVFLVGPKHSGKTSVGRALASLCSGCFVDLDELIAGRTGKSPRLLYAEGPEVFRRAEAESLSELVSDGRRPLRVVATGGGVVDNSEAMTLLEKMEQAVVVYLSVSAEIAWERISAAGELPPFLRTGNPRETHRALHERRAAAYRKIAGLVIEADGKSPEDIAGEIRNRLKR